MGVRAWDGEEGVSLVEIIVALFIFAILMGGAAASLTTSLALTREGRVRSVAANLAERELEVARSVPPENIVVGLVSATRTLDGMTYEVVREAEWVDHDATTGACGVGAGTPKVLRISVSVKADPILGGDVESQTIIAPDVGTFAPDLGHITAKIRGRDGGSPLPMPVDARSVSTGAVRTVVSNSEGCVPFTHLTAGTYEVTLDRSGYVDHQGQQVSTQNAGVVPATTLALLFDYDRAATLSAQLQGVNGGSVPDGLDVTVRNTALLPTPVKHIPGSGTLRSIPSLFPFSDGYEIWASLDECSENDPSTMSVSPATAPVDPASTTNVVVPLATLDIDLTSDDSDDDLSGIRLVADLNTSSACTPSRLELGVSDSDGELSVALPYGSWTVSAPSHGTAAVVDLLGPVDVDLGLDVS